MIIYPSIDHSKIRKVGSTATCARCVATYEVTAPRQKFCSACVEAHTKEANRKRLQEFKMKNPTYDLEAKLRKYENSAVHCAVCQQVFKSITKKKYCSPECRKIGFSEKMKQN
jgi:predicted nucleic acid-binding Zn ribbon protein